MVAVAHAATEIAAPEALAGWPERIGAAYSAADRSAIAAALEIARTRYGQAVTPGGETWIARAMGAAEIVAELKLDAASVRAALLVGVPHIAGFNEEAFHEQVGDEVAQLVIGVARMDAIRAAPTDAVAHKDDRAGQSNTQAENLRKMLLAMVEDIRVVLIKLAERTQALRFLDPAPGTRRPRCARRPRAKRSTCSRRSPTASASGSSSGSSRTCACACSSPRRIKRIARCSTNAGRSRALHRRRDAPRSSASSSAAGINADVTGRPKHIYSIWNKMRRKDVGIDALYDIRAVRILVDDVKDCYAALGIVHNLWTPLPQEFDDYIAKPKANAIARCTLPSSVPTASRWKCRSARTTCTSIRSTASLRTGATRRARSRPARPGLRRQDRVAAPGARLEGCRRRRRRVAAAIQVDACSSTRSMC